MHWRKRFNKETLGVWDLEGKKEVTVTIAGMSSREVYDRQKRGKKHMACADLKGTDKKLLLNVTNCTILESLYGTDDAGWIGKRITLYAGKSKSGKDAPIGICVRPTEPGASKQNDTIRGVTPPHDPVTKEVYEDGAVPPDEEPPMREPGEEG